MGSVGSFQKPWFFSNVCDPPPGFTMNPLHIYIQNLFDSYLQYLSKYYYIYIENRKIYTYIYTIYSCGARLCIQS